MSVPFKGATAGSFHPIIQPQEDDYSGPAGGAASPFIIEHPETLETKILYTGWEPGARRDRNLYVADINDALNVTNVTKVLDYSQFGSVEGAYGFYDKINSEWIIGMTTGGSTGLYVLAFSSDFSSLNSSKGYSLDTKDSGASAVPTYDGSLYLTAVPDSNRDITLFPIQSDFTTRPFESLGSGEAILPSDDALHVSVHHSQFSDSGLTTLMETRHTDKHWTVNPMFVGPGDGGVTSHAGLYSEKPLFTAGVGGGGGQFGHPSFSSHLSRQMVLFSWFRNCIQSEPDTYRHEIWCAEPNYDFDDPSNWLPLKGRLDLSQADNTKYVNTFGADKMIVQVDTPNTPTVTLKEGMSGAHIDNGVNSSRTWDITSTGVSKQVFTDIAPTVQFDLSAGAYSLDVVLR